LAAHNTRDWYEANKADYQTWVAEPMRALVAALTPVMLDIDPGFIVDPRRGAVSRIRRDTRFSRDKSPYRTNQWLVFKRPVEAWPDRPAYFMQFGPNGYACGMGFYQAKPATMAALREAIRLEPRPFDQAVTAAYAAGLHLEGERYRRPRTADGLSAAASDWWSRKTVYLIDETPFDEGFFTPGLADRLAEMFRAVAPLYRFIDEAIGG
jgi:uncharacterized protein (TIGR02453 family)